MDLPRVSQISSVVQSLIRDYKLPTPFLVIDESQIGDSLRLFQKYLPEVKLFYAVKANPSPEVISCFLEQGLSLDVASAGEIETAVSLGASKDKLYLSTPIKTPETLESMFRNGVALCAVDTVGEIEKIAAFAKQRKYSSKPEIFVRLKIESRNVEVDLNKKFGCSIVDALNIIEIALKHNFNIAGVCFHVGTQCTNADNYFLGIESAMLVAKEAFRKFNIRISTINIGGGFCDPITARNSKLDLDGFYAAISEACNEAIASGFRIFAEPGRCLVSSAGTLVTSVVGINSRNDHKWAYLDDGIYGCYSVKSYEKHDFEFHCLSNLRRVNSINSKRGAKCQWTIAGPTCDSLDVVAEDVELPGNLAIGDILFTPDIGAYSISTACSFNGFSCPKCYVVQSSLKNGRVNTAVRNSIHRQNLRTVANV